MTDVYEVLNELDPPVYGSPDYDGLEYDYEIPNEMIVASPGGASDIQHHWTKGFYGEGGSSWDVFGNEPPALVYGNEGSLYATDPTATQRWGPWPGGVYAKPPVGTSPEFLGAQPGPTPPEEPFNNDDNIEFVDAELPYTLKSVKKDSARARAVASREAYQQSDVNVTTPVPTPGPSVVRLNWKIVLVIMFAFIALSFWAQAVHCFIQDRVYRSRRLGWIVLGAYAFGFSILVLAFAWSAGVFDDS